ncbi:MAG: hypothetical protein E6Q97_18110, partial [Desulfurellales bacterium]
LREHVRLGAGQMTPAEVAARMTLGVDLERATSEARRLYTDTLNARQEADQVYERLRDMIDVGEFTPQATETKARLLAANIVTMARRNGESPLAMMERIGFDIRGPFEGQATRAVRDTVLARLDALGADIPVNEAPRNRIRVAFPRADGGTRVSAREATEDGEIETSWAKLQVRAGRDMVVGEEQGDARPVRRDIFEATYEEAEPGQFQKRTDVPVGYYVLDEARTIETLEGPVDAKAGDYVLIGAVGEQWPVRPEKFRERYREQVDPYAHFGGVQAIGAPLHTLQNARVMEANGVSEEKIWRETGWARGLDGMWRWEIDDSRAGWKTKVLDKFSSKTHLGEVIYYSGDIDAFLNFDELFAAYPVLGSLRLTLHIGPYNATKFERANGFLDPDMLYVRADTRERALEIVLHELQHAIQWIEAFTPGSGPRRILNEATWAEMGASPTTLSTAFEYFYRFHLKEHMAQRGIGSMASLQRYPALHASVLDYARQQAAFDVYQRVLGETEARAVQIRRGSTFTTRRKEAKPLSAAERKNTPPSQSFDVDPQWAVTLPPLDGALVSMRGSESRGFDLYGDRKPSGLGPGYGAQPGAEAPVSARRMAMDDVGAAITSLAKRIEEGVEPPPTHRNALRFGTEQDVADLRAMIARGATADEILSSPIMRAVEQHSAETPWTATREQATDPDFIDGREYVDPRNGEIVDAEEAIERLKDIYEAKAGGPVKQGFHAVIVVGHPGAGKSTFINGLARANSAAVLDADIAKEFVPSYDEGYNSQSVHFESAALRAAAQADFLDAGVNVIIERVGDSEIAIRNLLEELKKTGYTASIVHVAVDGDEAARRMASRFLSGGRYVDPAIFRVVMNKPAPAFARVIENAGLTGYVEINANGPPGQIVIEKQGGADAPALLAAIGGGTRSGALDDGGPQAAGRDSREASDAQGSGYAQDEVSPRLVAYHNLSAANLLFSKELGGVALPSIAVTKAGIGAPSGFGEITLIANRDLADPAQIPVFDGDVYSPRFPRAIWKKVRSSKIERLPLYKRLVALDKKYDDNASSTLWEHTVNSPDPEYTTRSMRDDISTMVAWLESKGEEAPEPIMRPANLAFEWIDQPAWLEFVASLSSAEKNGWNDTDAPQRAAVAAREAIRQYAAKREGRSAAAQNMIVERLSDGLVDEDGKLAFGAFDRGIFGVANVGKQVVDRYKTLDEIKARIGDRLAEYDAWVHNNVRALFDDPVIQVGRKKLPLTLENVVEAMSTTQVRNKEKGLAHGVGATRAALSKKIASLAEMRNRADWAIAKEKTIEDLRKEQEKIGDEWRSAVARYYKYKNHRGEPDYWNAFDGAMRAISRTRVAGARGLASALRSEGFEGVPAHLIEDGLAYAKALRETPVPYFEAKPQRAVAINEFVGAVIPQSASQDVRDLLDKEGIPYREYDGNTEDAQSAASDAFARELDAYFQASPRTGARGYFTPGYGRDGELNSAVINLLEARNLSTLFHEAGHLNLELLFDFARAANAPEGVKADAQTVLDWFGDGLTLETWQGMTIDQRRPYHEMFARGFEAYLLEGKAPSSALRQVFATVKAWLIQIYKSVLALKVDLTPEIRGVMDRLLASEEEIAAAQKLQGADAVMSREAFGGTDKQYARYLANIARAREDAETDLQATIMGAVFADRTRWWRSEERRQRETVEIDIDSQPIRQLYDWLSTGTWRHGPKPDWLTEDVRLSLAAVVRDYGQDAVDALPDDVKKLDVEQLQKIAVATRVALNKRGPQRLADWLLHYARKHGGIVDEAGGLQQVLDGKRGYGRVINDRGGRHLDDVAMAAWEAGFFGPPPGRVVDGGYAQDGAPKKREYKPSLRHVERWGDTIDDEASIQKALQRIVQIRNMTPINASWNDLRDAVRDLAELFENSTNRPVDYTSTVAQDRWHFGRQAEVLFERYDDADRYIFVEALKLDAEGRQRNRVLVEIAETLREWRNRGVRRKGLRDLFFEDIESDPRDKRRSELGLTQRTGFYSAVARAVKTMPDRQWQMGGEHVINWLLKQPGVKREEIEFLELPALIGRRDLTREEVENYIADRELRLQARFNKFDPENPSTDYDYGGTRAFAGPRIPGRGVYFEDRLAFPKRRPDGRDFAPGMFNSPHWDNHEWGSIRGSIRDVPGYGKTYIAEEIQSDFFQGAQKQGGNEPRRPRVSAEDYLSWKARRSEYSAARLRLLQRLDALRTVANYARWGTDLRNAIVEIEIWEKGDTLDDALANLSRLAEAVEASPSGNYREAALSDLDAIAAEFRAEPEFFEHGANRKFGNPESYYTPDSPFKDTWEDVLLKRLLIRAARENADAVAVSTSETTARIQNTAKAAGFYDEEFRVKLERLAREETGDPSLTIERVNLPTKRGQRAYSVWIVRLPEAARAQIRKRGMRYFQGDSVRNGERPTIREFLDRLNNDIRNDASPVYSSNDAEAVATRLEYEGWKRWFDEHSVDLKADAATLRQQLARAIAKGSEAGLHPDALANLFGIESGEALLRGLAQIEPREQAIKAELRKRMMDEFGDPLNDGTIAEEARLAAHRETRARVIELELEALARATGRASRPVNAAAKEIAERQIERMTVRQIRGYDWFLGNERREARNAVEAIQRGDMHAAEKHKHRQLVNFHLYRLARAAAEEMDVAQRYLKKFARPGVRDNIDGDYLDQIDALLAQFDLRKRSGSQMAGAASLSQWAADMERRGLGHLVNVDPRRLADAAKRPFSHLPIDEARGLVDTVKNIEHLGRLKEKLLAAADKRKFRETVSEVVEAIRATGPVSPATRRTYTPNAFERAQDWARRAHAEMTRMEFLFKHLDGKANGPVWNALWTPLARAADKESALMRDATKSMQAIWARYSGAEAGQMFSKRIDTPRLPVDGPAGRSTSFTKAEIITIALNWGNEGNRTALLNGFRWEEADVKDVLDRVLDARDWQTVQMIWDLIGTFRDEAFALQYDLTGVRPEAVEALPVETPFGTLRGGYYPLKYDGERNLVVARRDEMQTQLEAMGSNWHKPMTRKGHLEARVGSGGRPVKLSLDVFTEHVQNVAHDIAYRRAVIDIDRIIQDEEFAGAFIEAAGRPMYDQLRPWLQSIAADRSDPTAWMWRFLQKLRGNVAIAAMGYRLSTSLQQVTGLLQAVPELGSLEMAGALAKLTRNPAAMFAKAAVIEGKSEFMRSRRQT